MSTTKTIVYINSDIFGINVSDPFRRSANLFWHNHKPRPNRKSQFSNNQSSNFTKGPLQYSGHNNISPRENLKYELGPVANKDSDMWMSNKQSIQIYSYEEFSSDSEWATYVLGGVVGEKTYAPKVAVNTTYGDFVHRIDLPMIKTEEKTFTFSGNSRAVSIETEYNFYVSKYEKKISNPNFSETRIPSLHSLASALEDEEAPGSQNITGNGQLKKKIIGLFKKSGQPKAYFKEFAKNFVSVVGHDEAMRNVYFAPEDTKKLLDYNSKKNIFPMFFEIKLDTDPVVQFAQLVMDSNLSLEFSEGLHNRLNYGSQNFVHAESQLAGGSFHREQNRVFDVNLWFDNLQTNSGPPPGPGMPMGKGKPPGGPFAKQLSALTWLAKTRSYVKTRFRSFKDMIRGDYCQSETLSYRVAKFKGNGAGTSATPIQNFWFFNTGELDVLDFVDTQVKYNSEYTYRVYAYNFVLGTEYVYRNLAISETVSEDCIQLIDQRTGQPVNQKVNYRIQENPITRGGPLIPIGKNPKYIAEFDVVTRPALRVVESLVFSKTLRMIDSPPMPPYLTMLPLIGIKNKIKIWFEGRMGSMSADPISIDESDKELFDEIKNSRGLVSDDKIYYSSDDPNVIYEIYRLSKKPTSYEDFKNNLRVKIDLRKGRLKSQEPHSSGGYLDTIKPNQRYYYAARCVDIHNNISNPSIIHEIEMVEDKGAVYLVHNIVDLDIPKPHMVSKPMKRFIYITPTIGQSLIGSDLTDVTSAKDINFDSAFKLGAKEESIWGKNIKMRLISKKTGKKVDINLNFKTEHITSDVENE
jgi:hypothetical protein